MNPLLYKAYPLMSLTIDILTNPSAHSSKEISKIALLYLVINAFWATWLWLGTKKVADFTLSALLAYVLALPSLVLYLLPMLTILNDVSTHEFSFSNRFILVFYVVLATQMLGGFYAIAIRYPRNRLALGLQDGMAISLWMWLFSIPIGVAWLCLNAYLRFV